MARKTTAHTAPRFELTCIPCQIDAGYSRCWCHRPVSNGPAVNIDDIELELPERKARKLTHGAILTF